MSSPFVAEIRIFPFNFAPHGWALCDGQLLPISQNTALFSLLGTTYGGNGKSNFALPNLQDTGPMQWGQGAGLSLRDLGETAGSPAVTLLNSEMPIHTHSVNASNAGATQADPGGNIWAAPKGDQGATPYYTTTGTAMMNPSNFAMAGGSLPHNNMHPFLVLNFCIAMQGIFPARS
jgi:microcystin-dependent protein